MMTLDSLAKLGKDFGVPTVFCAALCFAIWSSARWTAIEVVKPIINEHLNYLKGEESDRKEMKTALVKQTDILKEIRDDQRKFPAVAEKMP